MAATGAMPLDNALYDGHCWCTLPVIDHGVYQSKSTNPNENNPSALSAIMSTIVYDMRKCSNFSVDQYAMNNPLRCNHLTPAITQVEGVNAVACRYEFSTLFEQASSFSRCTTVDSCTAAADLGCCSVLLNLERYNCLCYDRGTAGALAEADLEAVVSLFECCNLTSPDCSSMPPATYYPSGEQYNHSLYRRTPSSRRAVMRASDCNRPQLQAFLAAVSPFRLMLSLRRAGSAMAGDANADPLEYYHKWRSWDADLWIYEMSKVEAIKIAL
eukprot:gene29083-36158_t